ncbi:NPCBM/NEW2 domain-containing protein [Streptomyces sp. NRRL F-2580]|uniref:NPCBM/NEW2 domain-containing protein n=1 Tax=Streptomyces sp. NRRL F-2580 TaxID=1463841 RepID=UPI000AA327F5|nr:NPCBM/NEW2 domain-containing protein [Streptomyces sp. NRRL F-2580]
MTGLSSREFAQLYPVYKDSTIRKYVLGANLPPWDFLRDLLTEAARRTGDRHGEQRARELFDAYRELLVQLGADVRGSDQNSLLLRLLDGERALNQLGVELSGIRDREDRLRENLARLQNAAADGTGSGEAAGQLREQGEALARQGEVLDRRRVDLVADLDRTRSHLMLLEAAEESGGDQHHPVVPSPPTMPPQIGPARGGGRGRYRIAGAVLVLVLVLGGGLAAGIHFGGGNSPDGGDRAVADRTVSASAHPDPSKDSARPSDPPAGTPSAAPTPEQNTRSLIEDLVPMDTYPEGTKRSFTAGELSVNSRVYPRTLYAFEAQRTWQLDRKYKTFTAGAGVSDSTPSGDTITFSVQIDGANVKEFTMRPGDPVKEITLDIQGAFRITITTLETFSTQEGRGAWIDPVVSK